MHRSPTSAISGIDEYDRDRSVGLEKLARNLKKFVPTAIEKDAADAAIGRRARQVKFTIIEFPIRTYVDRFKSDTGDRYFVPEYQRNQTWNPLQTSEFIESLLIGLPIPFLFFYQTPQGRMEIVDGSQRMRAIRAFLEEEFQLGGLNLVEELNGFRFEDLPQHRRHKLEDTTIRTIVLDPETDPVTRAEMFARINRAGTLANEAEVRRGSLPGPVLDLIMGLAESPRFVEMTPISRKAADQREREELVTRFFAYVDGYDEDFPGYRDQPRRFLFDFLKRANAEAEDRPAMVNEMRREFERMLDFVDRTFPNRFQKPDAKTAVARVRFEAISVGTALALRERPEIVSDPGTTFRKMEAAGFNKIVVSDGANVRSKLVGRIKLVKSVLLES